MVGLVIEEMRQHPRQRRFMELAGHVAIAERAADGFVAEAADEAEDARILDLACRPEIGERVVENLVQSLDAARHSLETAHPDAIADEDVVERRMNRAEEGRPIRAVVGRAQRGAGLIEATIGPGVVAAEAMEVAAVHAGSSSCRRR